MADILSFNGLVKILQDLAIRHDLIDTFMVGSDSEIGESQDVVYPLFQIHPESARMPVNAYNEYKTIEVDCNFKVIDKVHQDEGNENDVISDCLRILQDIINELNQHPFYRNSRVKILGDISFDELEEFEDDFTAGWSAQVTFQFINHNTYCGLPISEISGFSAAGPGCPTVLVQNSDISYQQTVNAGSALNLPDITVTTGSGNLTYPSVVDINLSGYTSGSSIVTGTFNGASITDTPCGQNKAITVKNITGGTIGTAVTDTANNLDIEVDDVTVDNSDVSFTVDISPEQVYEIPDITVTTGSGNLTYPAAIDINLSGYSSGATTLNTSDLYLDGQVTSYRSGDNVGFGRGTDWWNLGFNNAFGNGKRFTGTNGGYEDELSLGTYYDKNGVSTTYALAFPNDIMLDHSQWNQVGETILGINMNVYGAQLWNTYIDNILASTYAGYSDWIPMNKNVICIMSADELDGGAPRLFNYAPIKYQITAQAERLWTKTTGGISSRAYFLVENGGIQNTNKTASASYIECRIFTYTDLGL